MDTESQAHRQLPLTRALESTAVFMAGEVEEALMVQTRMERSPSPATRAIVRFPPSIKAPVKALKWSASLELDTGALVQD